MDRPIRRCHTIICDFSISSTELVVLADEELDTYDGKDGEHETHEDAHVEHAWDRHDEAGDELI